MHLSIWVRSVNKTDRNGRRNRLSPFAGAVGPNLALADTQDSQNCWILN